MDTKPVTRVLYHCSCHLGVISDQRALDEANLDPIGPLTSSAPIRAPALPSQEPSARYAFHPLPQLYFCADCLCTRCNLCSLTEIVTHYCPSCLFEVPSASVKTDRNRCPRNCFICPTKGCGSYLSVLATDPNLIALGGKLESGEASIGRPPYFLSCLRCKWDSKKGMTGGYTFEKPTGISAQLDAQRGTFVGQAEMDKLRTHFDVFLRKQQQQQQQIQMLQQHQSGQQAAAGKLPSLSTSLSKSKLFRDVPVLTDSSKYLSGSRRAGAAALGLTYGKDSDIRIDDQPPPYASEYTSHSNARPRHSENGDARFRSDELGIMGQREEHYRTVLASLGREGNVTMDLSGDLMYERYLSGWDSGPLHGPNPNLEPLRVPLETKKTYRCPACRHILVKPDPKATSYRWKIKLSAMNYLPEIHVKFKDVKTSASSLGNAATASSAIRRTSTLNLPPRSSLTPLSGQQGLGHHNLSGNEISKLRRGRTYEYEVSFKNPLEDVISIHLSLIQPARRAHRPSRETNGRKRPRAPWFVRASAHNFKVKPFDDVDIVIDDDLLDDPRTRAASRLSGDVDFPDEDDEEYEDLTDNPDEGNGEKTSTQTPAVGSGGSRLPARLQLGKRFGLSTNGLQRGIVRQKGNETVIALRVSIDAELNGRQEQSVGENVLGGSLAPNSTGDEILDVEVAMRVTFTYRLDDEGHGDDVQPGRPRQAESGGTENEGGHPSASDVGREETGDRSISFWTAVHLGQVEPLNMTGNVLSAEDRPDVGSSARRLTALSAPQNTEAKTEFSRPEEQSFSAEAPETSGHANGEVLPSDKAGSSSDTDRQDTIAPGSQEPSSLLRPEDQAARLERLRKRRSEMFSTHSR